MEHQQSEGYLKHVRCEHISYGAAGNRTLQCAPKIQGQYVALSDGQLRYSLVAKQSCPRCLLLAFSLAQF